MLWGVGEVMPRLLHSWRRPSPGKGAAKAGVTGGQATLLAVSARSPRPVNVAFAVVLASEQSPAIPLSCLAFRVLKTSIIVHFERKVVRGRTEILTHLQPRNKSGGRLPGTCFDYHSGKGGVPPSTRNQVFVGRFSAGPKTLSSAPLGHIEEGCFVPPAPDAFYYKYNAPALIDGVLRLPSRTSGPSL